MGIGKRLGENTELSTIERGSTPFRGRLLALFTLKLCSMALAARDKTALRALSTVE
jgi:hypothetical protein